MSEKTITIFGTWWCGDCSRARRYFDKNHIVYKWVDIDSDEIGEEFVLTTNNGMRSVPTIVFNDNYILVEPTDVELQQKFGTVLTSG
jgi:mycoredoxin